MSIIEKVIEKVGSKGKEQTHKKKDHLSENKLNVELDPVSEEFKADLMIQNRAENVPLVANIKTNSDTSKVFFIDRKKLTKQGFLCSENTNSQLAEEYRLIKRPLINNTLISEKNGINRANLILITSGLPGEGKTYTAINLALSIASERNKKVLLVDADVAKPSITKELDLRVNSYGLIDYLDGKEINFSEMIIKTDIPGLSVIPAGKTHGYSTELLAGNRMASLADELHSRYSDRIVIFDSPPLLAATQAEVLAGLVGQTVLVIEAEKTLQSMVLESINKLKVCDVVLALLNKSQVKFDSNIYSYGQYGH